MPIKIEHLTAPTDADWNDLEKIRLDTEPAGFSLNQTQLKTWIQDGGWIIAGRFNDRLIGALLAKNADAEIELSSAGVRTITQRRGVMHQMLELMKSAVQESGETLCIKELPAELEQALSKRGFIQNSGEWRFDQKSPLK